MTRFVALAALALTGCSETWYSHDVADLDLTIDQVTHVDATIVTPPGAWPREVYDQALRLGMDGQSVAFVGEITEDDDAYEIDDHWGDNVNVLDAWKTCDHTTECERVFRFEIACVNDGGQCTGTVSADAFIAIEDRPRVANRTGDPLTLTLSESI